MPGTTPALGLPSAGATIRVCVFHTFHKIHTSLYLGSFLFKGMKNHPFQTLKTNGFIPWSHTWFHAFCFILLVADFLWCHTLVSYLVSHLGFIRSFHRATVSYLKQKTLRFLNSMGSPAHRDPCKQPLPYATQ